MVEPRDIEGASDQFETNKKSTEPLKIEEKDKSSFCFIIGDKNGSKEKLCQAFGGTSDVTSAASSDISFKSHTIQVPAKVTICAEKESSKDWKNAKETMEKEPYDVLVIAGVENIAEYTKVPNKPKNSFLFIQNGEHDKDEAAELAEKYQLALIYEDVTDPAVKKNIKAFLRNVISEIRLSK